MTVRDQAKKQDETKHHTPQKHPKYLAAGAHDLAAALGAKLGERAVQDAGGVVKVDRVDGEPLVEVFSRGEAHGLAQVAAAERRVDVALELQALFVLFFGVCVCVCVCVCVRRS